MQTEENALELALMLAASEPGHRPEFYRLLLESTVFVLGSSGLLDEGPVTLKENTTVQIAHWVKPDGSPVIPFFSSLRTLQLAIEGDERYMALPARAIFSSPRGHYLHRHSAISSCLIQPINGSFLPTVIL